MSFIELELDQGALDEMLHSRGGLVDQFIQLFTMRVLIRAKVTVPRRSFELAEAHEIDREGADGWEVVANMRYALALHNGVKARVIVPRRAKVLRWRDDETGEVVFAAKVKQKARPGVPWLRRALETEIAAL